MSATATGGRIYEAPPAMDGGHSAAPHWFMYLLIAAMLIVASNYDPLAGRHGGFQGEEWNETKRESIGQIGEGGPIRGVALLLLSGVSLLYLTRPVRFERSGHRWGRRSMLAFGGVAVASIAWSDDPLVSVKRAGAVAVAMLLAVALSRRWSWTEILMLALVTTGIVTLGGLLLSVIFGDFRPWEGGYRFAPMSHPNPTAQDCAILVMAAAGLAIAGPRRRLMIAICAVAGVCMFLTRSRTSVASFLVAAVTAGFFARPRRELVFGALLVGALVAAAVVFVPDIHGLLTGTATMGRQDVQGSDIGTFTGRTYIWQMAYTFFLERPLQGFGFGGFWIPQRIDMFAAQLGWVFFHAHSGYVDAALGLGVIGLTLYISLLGTTWFESWREWRQHHGAGALFALTLVTFMAVCSFAETFFPLANLPSFFAMMAVARLSYSDQEIAGEVVQSPVLQSTWREHPRLAGALPAASAEADGWRTRP